jgi:hypothetical protein
VDSDQGAKEVSWLVQGGGLRKDSTWAPMLSRTRISCLGGGTAKTEIQGAGVSWEEKREAV